MPAIAMPAFRNRSNIHFSAPPGNPRNVGAYHTHGMGSLGDLTSG